MADNTRFATGDNLWSMTKKLLDGFNNGNFSLSGGGGGGGGGGAVTVADGADVTQGAKADATQLDPANPGSVIAFLKGILGALRGDIGDIAVSCTGSAVSISGGTTEVTQATAADLNATVVGNVGGKTTLIKDTTAVSTSPAYTAGDAVGGKRTLSSALTSVGTGILESITILDRANQKAAMTLFIFDADPSAATITDNSAFVFSTDDLKVIAQINIAAADYVTTNSKAIAQKTGLGMTLKSAGTTLYAALVTTGTPTFAATSDVQLEFGILQD